MASRRTIWLVMLGLMFALAPAIARAAESKFSLAVQADGITLGTAAATLSVAPSTTGSIAWKLTDGLFTALPNADGELKWDAAILTGNGEVKPDGTADLKDFDITLQQSTGVDVIYRFRISATLAGGAVKSVSIAQVK